LEATVYYRDESREPDRYRDVAFITNGNTDVAWLIEFVDGGGVYIAFSEVLKIEQTVQGGEQKFEGEEKETSL
jgi:hypothetical protein